MTRVASPLRGSMVEVSISMTQVVISADLVRDQRGQSTERQLARGGYLVGTNGNTIRFGVLSECSIH
jgi:hypothetical protein